MRAAQELRVQASDLCQFPPGESGDTAVVLTPQRGDRCRAHLRLAVDRHRQVHAQEGVAGIRDGIDVSLQSARLPARVPVQALEGQHAVVLAHAEPMRNRVGMQAGRIDDVPNLEASILRRLHPSWTRRDNGRTEPYLPAATLHPPSERTHHGHRVRHGRRRRPQCTPHRARERLEFSEPLLVDKLDVDTVGLSSRRQLVQGRQFSLRRRDHDLPRLSNGDTLLRAEGAQHRVPIPRETGLQGVGCVVEAGVQHAAVATGCVLREPVLLVEHDDSITGPTRQPGIGQGEADNATADDRRIGRWGHGPSLGRSPRGSERDGAGRASRLVGKRHVDDDAQPAPARLLRMRAPAQTDHRLAHERQPETAATGH